LNNSYVALPAKVWGS